LIGGNGEKRIMSLVARYADEWNSVFLKPEEFSRLNIRLDELLRSAGREPKSVRRSMMAGLLFGRTQEKLDEQLSELNQTAKELCKLGAVVGVGEEVYEQLKGLRDAGLERIMLQWLDLDDLQSLAALAKAVL
jgi:alkanesulfonate monooxygenase SsuD/methylene tetrahydromethanopterin reductase-like flavin-dependent oxidoreductase (luciferase family)